MGSKSPRTPHLRLCLTMSCRGLLPPETQNSPVLLPPFLGVHICTPFFEFWARGLGAQTSQSRLLTTLDSTPASCMWSPSFNNSYQYYQRVEFLAACHTSSRRQHAAILMPAERDPPTAWVVTDTALVLIPSRCPSVTLRGALTRRVTTLPADI